MQKNQSATNKRLLDVPKAVLTDYFLIQVSLQRRNLIELVTTQVDRIKAEGF